MTDVDAARTAFVQKMLNGTPDRVAAPYPNTPVFKAEGPQVYAKATQRNQQFTKPGSTLTTLTPHQELLFQHWVQTQQVPFDPHEKNPDYDMRGYWLANPGAQHGNGQHFPDTWKRPNDATFSNQSKYATKDNPFVWQGNNLVDSRTGQLVMKG